MRRSTGAAMLALFFTTSAVAADNRFCGGPVPQTGEPTDLAHVVGDQTLEYIVDQPASLMVCSKGYLLEKCGDHDNARKVFDKCIAAGYIGAMIWKALMLQDGAGGVRPDLPAAAELMHRAALAGDSPYATLGKLHYASALQEGRGVPKDEVEARKWFEAAARDGNPDAIEFLRTGYHVGDRDGQARGTGTPPPPVPVGPTPPLPGELFEAAQPKAPPRPAQEVRGASARRLLDDAPPVSPPPPATAPVSAPVAGQHLAKLAEPVVQPVGSASGGLAALFGVLLLSGALRQSLRAPTARRSLFLSRA
ncbi:MAG: sel1 repeat family protein [Proteobacteria bacterium]|nr:sel1 repeat family protein [Pseudomonadota bacterium]